MKKIVMVAILMSGLTGFAQKKDKIVTSQVKKQTVVKDGEVINQKTKVITEKTQAVKFDKDQKHQLNQDRVPAPVAVTKTIMIDNDRDPFYDKVTKVKYYNMDNKKFSFRAEGNSLRISEVQDDKEVNIGRAVRSRYNNYYVIRGNTMNGVGYYTEDNTFVIEYYDPETEDTKVMMFEDMEF